MGKSATPRVKAAMGTAAVLLATAASWAQAPAAASPAALAPDWYHLGNSLIDLSLAGLASGPVNRVWYSSDGGTLNILTASGKTYSTNDFEHWQGSSAAAPPPQEALVAANLLPERGAAVRGQSADPAVLYAFNRFVYRSEDGGLTWDDLTGFRSQSLVGVGLRDLAVSPQNPDDVTVAGSDGVFRSLDGGKTWSGLNHGLHNLRAARILSLPVGDRGVELQLAGDAGINSGTDVIEWQPGERRAWRPADNTAVLTALQLRQALSPRWGTLVTAISIAGDTIYAGTADGRIAVSSDGGVTWPQTFAVNQGGPVERFWVDPGDPRVALAVLGSHPRDPLSGVPPAHVFRTENAGAFWDDLTSNLPDAAANGITAVRASGAIYVATDRGVFYTRGDLNAPGPATSWQQLRGLPDAPASDVRLDSGGNQLWVDVAGYGVYCALAPHRLGDPRVVSAADLVARAAAPGSLMTITGARVGSARSGDLNVPVLAADSTGSQIQIPFDASGSSLPLSIDSGSGSQPLAALPLESASPAIFVDRDGAPLLLDASTGTLLDAMHPAHSRARIQILATGLGRVNPDWPAGLAAPQENPPQVTANVQAWLDGEPVVVTRAELCPGYIGYYLVEIEIPKIVNYGPAELYMVVDGHTSNRVRVYIEP
jgi:uncharacterized protein (TIGR03437 family)